MNILYRQVASEIEGAITNGIFLPGARLPSIRKTAQRYDVSLSTVIEAYGILEDNNLIEARFRSGHFVKQPRHGSCEPEKSLPKTEASRVSISRMAMELCALAKTDGITSLGPSFPGVTMLVQDGLKKSFVRSARMNAPQLVLNSPAGGAQSLRCAVARLLVESGCMVHEDDVIITNGAQEALALGLRAVTRPGDTVAVESPVYFGILQAIEVLDLKAIELPTDPRTGADLNVLEQLAADGQIQACILSPTYQNPLGYTMTENDKRRAVQLLERHRIPLIEDDAYGQLGPASQVHRPAKCYDLTGNVMHIGSFSKTVSPSLRIGWLIPGRAYDEVRRQKFLLNLNTSLAPQLALADFLKGSRFRKSTTAAARLYQVRLARLRSAILTHFPKGTKCTVPTGGMALWVEMPHRFSSMSLAYRALKQGISVFPGWIFGGQGGYENCLRLSVGQVEEPDLCAAAVKLGSLAHDCKEG